MADDRSAVASWTRGLNVCTTVGLIRFEDEGQVAFLVHARGREGEDGVLELLGEHIAHLFELVVEVKAVRVVENKRAGVKISETPKVLEASCLAKSEGGVKISVDSVQVWRMVAGDTVVRRATIGGGTDIKEVRSQDPAVFGAELYRDDGN
jgi:hypothetical protein